MVSKLISRRKVIRLPINVFPCEDCYAQERLTLKEVLSTMEPSDVWIAGHNFCMLDFTCGIAFQQAYFMTREKIKSGGTTLKGLILWGYQKEFHRR